MRYRRRPAPIWKASGTHWGEAQAEDYTRNIQAACEALSEGALVKSLG